MRARRGLIWALPVVLALVVGASQLPAVGLAAQGKSTPAASSVTSPEKFFGFQMGADRRIARWTRSSSTTSSSKRRAPRSRSSTWGRRPWATRSWPSSSRRRPTWRSSRRCARSTRRSAIRAGGRGGHQEARRRRQGRHHPVDEPARQRDRRCADDARAGLRPPQPQRTRRRSGSSTTSCPSWCRASTRTARSW